MSFIFSQFLWLLPLISLPIIFHLLNKRNYKQVDFSTLKFFKRIENDAIKKVSIINILLLIIRTMIIFSIIMILSRPIYKIKSNSLNSNTGNSLIAVIIDDSISNSYFYKNSLSRLLKKLKKDYNHNNQINIYTLNNGALLYDGLLKNLVYDNIIVENSFFTDNKEIIINEILKLKNNDIYSNIDYIFYSDFQADFINDLSFVKLINDYKEKSNIIFYKNVHEINNLSLSNIYLDKTIIIPNEIVTISATITNNTNKAYLNKKVNLFIEDINVGTYTIDLNEFESKDIIFKTSYADFGNHNCRIEIQNDDIYHDNIFYFNINIKEGYNIYVIYNIIDDYYYLGNAIQAINNRYNNINVKYLQKEEFLYINEDIDALFIFGYNNINSNIINKISTTNTNTIIFCDNNITNNTNLHDIFSDNTINNTKVNKLTDQSFVTLNTKTINDTYLSNLFNTDTYNRDIKIFNYKQHNVSPSTLISYSNNLSFLNKYIIDENNYFLFSTSLNLIDNNLPIKGSFIPFIFYLINENINSSYSYDELKDFNFKNISNSKIEVASNTNSYIGNINDSYKLFFADPGFYNLIGKNKNKSQQISLNLNRHEYTKQLSNDDLTQTFPNIAIIDNYSSFSNYINQVIHGKELWRYFLILLILLIVLEMYISNIYVYRRK